MNIRCGSTLVYLHDFLADFAIGYIVKVIRCVRHVTFVLVNMAAIATDDRARAGGPAPDGSVHLISRSVRNTNAPRKVAGSGRGRRWRH